MGGTTHAGAAMLIRSTIQFLTALALLATVPGAAALTVHEAGHAAQADLRIYVVDHAAQADLRVYWVDYASQARGDALWWRAKYAAQAERRIVFVRYAAQADLKVYFVKHAAQAGWNGPPRGLAIRRR